MFKFLKPLPSTKKRISILIVGLFFLVSLLPIWSKILSDKTTIVNRIDLPANASVAVYVQIGGFLFDIEGLTSPWAKVDFYSTEGNIQVTTIADKDGVFHFNSVLAPLQTGDFCFLSYDTDGIANNPLCFSPPPPQTRTTIKGIILSPSISLDKKIFKQNELVEARGRTFPHATLQTFLFEQEKSFWAEFIDVIIPAAIAREGPKAEFNSDENGFFSFNLPTQKSTHWRMFIGPQLEDGTPTAQSNVLEFSALSWWQWFLLQLIRFIYRTLRWFFTLLFKWQTICLLLILSVIFIWYKSKKMEKTREKK